MFGFFHSSNADELDRRNPYYAAVIHEFYDAPSGKHGSRKLYTNLSKVMDNDYNNTITAVKEIGLSKTLNNLFDTFTEVLSEAQPEEKYSEHMKTMGMFIAMPTLGRIAIAFAPALSLSLDKTPHVVTTKMYDNLAEYYNGRPRHDYFVGISAMCADLKEWANERQRVARAA